MSLTESLHMAGNRVQDINFISAIKLYIIAFFFSCILLANSADYCVNHSIVCKMNLSPSLGETMPVIKMWTCRDYVQYFHFGDYKARNVPHMLPHGGLWRRKKHLLLVLD